MAQTQQQLGQVTLKPITLTIIPAASQLISRQISTPVSIADSSVSKERSGSFPTDNKQQIISSQSLGQPLRAISLSHAPKIQGTIPNFNHLPVTPVITPNNSNNISSEEKERIRLEKQRQCKTRYNNKVKNYAKLGTIDREEDKVKALLLLCYPWLNNMSNNELDLRVAQFIRSLSQPITQESWDS